MNERSKQARNRVTTRACQAQETLVVAGAATRRLVVGREAPARCGGRRAAPGLRGGDVGGRGGGRAASGCGGGGHRRPRRQQGCAWLFVVEMLVAAAAARPPAPAVRVAAARCGGRPGAPCRWSRGGLRPRRRQGCAWLLAARTLSVLGVGICHGCVSVCFWRRVRGRGTTIVILVAEAG